MVPADPLKILLRLVGIVLGGLVLSLVVTTVVLVPVGHWYEMNKAQSESDLTRAVALALAVQVACAVVGGWFGDWLVRRWLRKRPARPLPETYPGSTMSFVVRAFLVIAGAIVLGSVFYKLIGPVGHWYEFNFAQNDHDLGRAYMVALAVQLAALMLGGWLGNRLFRRWRGKPSDRP